MAQQYGRTWWGQQWLKALDRIDYSNRLARGKSYANSGKVLSIDIQTNVIRSKVSGSQRKPYDVSIVVQPFTVKEKNVLVENIKGNALILSQLLNRQLPNELLAIAEHNKIKLFAQSWQDIKLNCSCPDWAVPCKHLAAVIYTVANEIDQNPFRVFTLHDFDLTKELAIDRLNMLNLEVEKINSLSDCVELKRKQKVELDEKRIVPDFSVIENLSHNLPMLFPSSPLFYGSDFKLCIQNFYKRRGRIEADFLDLLKQDKVNIPSHLRYFHFKFVIDINLDFAISATDEQGESFPIEFEHLLLLIAQTESKHLSNYSESFIYMYRTFRFCNILAERNALLPRLLKCENDTFMIQWIPALMNESVKSTFDELLKWSAEDMVLLRQTKVKGKQKPKIETSFLTRVEELILLCSLFLGKSASSGFGKLPGTIFHGKQGADEKIIHLFFNNRRTHFGSFSEKEIPSTVQIWLKRFFLGKREFTPVLQVSEIGDSTFGIADGFEMEVLMRNNDGIQTFESLNSFLQRENGESFDALKNLQLLSHYLPELDNLIASRGKEKLRFELKKFSQILTEILPAIKLLGISVLLPKSLQSILKPKLTLALKAKAKSKAFFSLEDTMNFDWKIAVGNHFINPAEFKKLSVQTNGLVKIRDQYVMMSKDEVERIIKKLESSAEPSSFELLHAALSEDYQGSVVTIDAKLRAQIKSLTQTKEVQLPVGVKAQLRPYQLRGYSWLYKNAKLGLGSLLADDMGLGKTLQVITVLQKFKEENLLKMEPAIVIAPTSLLSNWQNEIAKFAPGLRSLIYHGVGRRNSFKNIDVVITTYGVVRSEIDTLRKSKWFAIIIDEAQNIKNNNIAQTKAVKKMSARIKIAMTGTPVENRLSEYWSIFDFVNPHYLGNESWFENYYGKAIELNQDRERLGKFLKITSPFILRRVKTDKSIIEDLPEKIESNQFCNLSREQAALYKNLTTDLLQEMEQSDGIKRRGLILKLLTALKQICNHPEQYLKTKSDINAGHSGKILLLMQLLETIYENNEKVLIFSQYMEAGKIVQQIIQEYFGKKALQLHGGNSRKERDEMVQEFQNNPMHDTFILSLKAGGTGLNLTAGNHVIHFDLWWNPAAEAQATDRAFRIGQKKNVMVHRLITKGTLEEKIDLMLTSKRHLANMTVASGEKWIGELSDTEIKELVTLAE